MRAKLNAAGTYIVKLSLSKGRPGSLGAEGQLESMAAENTEMLTAKAEDAQVPQGLVLHRGNGS